jgi:hypothetical protein
VGDGARTRRRRRRRGCGVVLIEGGVMGIAFWRMRLRGRGIEDEDEDEDEEEEEAGIRGGLGRILELWS